MKHTCFLSAVLTFTVSGCFDKSSKQHDSGSSESPPKDKIGDIDVNGSDQPLAALNLCQSMMPVIPDHLVGKGPGVAPGAVAVASLAERKKSREACSIRQKVREALLNQEQMAMSVCLIESQKGIKAGGKYRMEFPGIAMRLTQAGPDGGMEDGFPEGMPGDPEGPGGMQDSSGDPETNEPTASGPIVHSVFLDNSDTEQFKIFFCENDKLTQKVVLSKANEKGSRGSYKSSFNDTAFSIAVAGSFDNGVGEANRQKIISQMAFTGNFGQDKMTIRSNMQLDLATDGISIIKVANESSSTLADVAVSEKEIGASLIGPNIGSALFQRTFQGDNTFFPGSKPAESDPKKVNVETSRSFFDTAGQTLEQKDSDAFKEGGALFVKEDMFPKLLPVDFNVQFEPGDWDCSGTTEVVIDEAAAKETEAKFSTMYAEEQCDADPFVPGFEEDIPSVIDQREDFKLPEFEDIPSPEPTGTTEPQPE